MKSIIIVGAGIAGLSAGIYARKNGYEVMVYESHFLPGGMCTGWKRKGYVFEGCFHYIKLLGIEKSNMFHGLWKQLGALNTIKMIHQDYIQSFRDGSGKTLQIYTDPRKLEKEFLEYSPVDRKMIQELCKTIQRCYWFTHTTGKNLFLFILKIINILSAMPFIFKYGKLSLKEYAMFFKNPFLQHSIKKMFDYEEISCIQLPMFLGLYGKGSVNFPEGGSLALVKEIEKTYLQLGGKIKYKTPVIKIITENNVATGIQLEDKSIQKADIIISAADGYHTLFHLLSNNYTTTKLRELYDKQPVYTSFIQVSLGLQGDLKDLPYFLRVRTENHFNIAGEQRQELSLVYYHFDLTLSPPDKNVLVILYTTDYSWWEKLEYHSPDYQLEKERILKTSIEQLEIIFPGISSKIEVTDVATPYTTIRYTKNWKSALGFIPTANYIQELRNPQFQIEGLSNFYMVGQWVSGMGVPNAALSGKNVVKTICKADKNKFTDN